MRKKILFKEEEISREIERFLREKRLGEGSKLPSERELSERFGVQRGTVRNALGMLIKKGVLIKKPRQGYFVAPVRIELDLNNFRSMKQALESLGRESRAKLINFEMISMSEKLAGKTLLPEGTLCRRVVRLRFEDDIPISIERSYLIAEHVPDLRQEDVDNRSMTATLRNRYGIRLVSSHQRITQVYATAIETELLNVEKDEPLLRYEGLSYDRQGRLIEFFDNVMRIDAIEFRLREFV